MTISYEGNNSDEKALTSSESRCASVLPPKAYNFSSKSVKALANSQGRVLR